MAALLLSILTVAAPGDADASSPELRKFYDIAQDVRHVIRDEARAESKSEKAAAIHAMSKLYLEIKRDPRLGVSDSLKSYKAKLWSRMTSIKKKLVREFDLPSRPAPRRAQAPRPKSSVDDLANEISGSLADQLSVVGGSMGGPAQVYTSGAGDSAGSSPRGGAAKFDYGPSLVDLIERTIQPEFWDTNGGPGSIFYYKPLHALVVSATSEIHHALGGTLGGLRDVMN